MNSYIEFKADRFRFLKFHLLGGFLVSIIGGIFFGSLYGSLGFMIACLIAAIYIFFIDTKRYDIFIKPNEIEGPIRFKTSVKRISVLYELIDLSRSRNQSFWRAGYIATKDGNKIWIYHLYFNMKQTNRIFEELKKKLENRSE